MSRVVYKFEELFETMTYPAGEPHVRFRSNAPEFSVGELDETFILAQARDFNDLAIIRLASSILGHRFIFVIPYIPAARHDRLNDVHDSLPLDMVKYMLKGIDVIGIDIHSDVAGFTQIHQDQVVGQFDRAGLFENNPVVAIPDAGAIKKANVWLGDLDFVQCLKTRDPATGKLSGFQVVNPEKVKGRDVVIVDDICDGGGTFIGLGDVLRSAGARKISLAVTHGLFTQGLSKLLAVINDIYTLDIYGNEFDLWDKSKLKQISTEKLIKESEFF